MALSLKSLVKLQQIIVGDASGNPTAQSVYRFGYATADAAATVETAGYFNNARQFLTVGSTIETTMAAAGTPVTKTYVATAVPATGNVTVVLQATTAG